MNNDYDYDDKQYTHGSENQVKLLYHRIKLICRTEKNK
jgi:hypothetical protein